MTNTCSEVFFENIPRIPHNKPLAFEMESKTTVLMTFDFSTQTSLKSLFCVYFVLFILKEIKLKMFFRGFRKNQY